MFVIDLGVYSFFESEEVDDGDDSQMSYNYHYSHHLVGGFRRM